MKQAPSNLKFSKSHKVSNKFLKVSQHKSVLPEYGFFALISLQASKLNFRHIEAGRRAIKRTIKKKANIWIKVFPYASVSKKSSGVRMGKGKGSHSFWICPIRSGQIIYETDCLSVTLAKKALISAAARMPMKTAIIRLTY